ncbi:site-specific DNA-methyltransferase [Rhizobium leguminosarum]|uniref:site-specific DNA-methyltransferase n=1 Tax=Rhizobium leguminosarum TaxID=384 RepID=UPI00144198E6|nr:site-specific DNA-methyltransferase [Rhizobium leguminosarum]MBY5841085.1 site-specific DNA-methyltransferase [Rhizobium leguminosarum]NKM80404.1 site-specific DNA-methyltransferase [Rhizobium leguminosarum bv. viciae]QSZ07017.1 site-specific DNA-methyltransferase [Rhizobium leguminosarum]
MPGKYDDLTKSQLIELLEKRDRTKKLGLVWERDELEADAAVDENFIACEIIPELSDKPAPWKNLVIEGDNYDALRWLRMTHAAKVKCIYIDPPYNTGNKDWVYNDRYMDADNRFRQSTWLEFLYRRLTLARDLLTEDGVILVSINDEQRALLELLMDEALPGMRVGSLVWRTRSGGNEGGKYFFTDNHEYILVFAKDGFRFGGSEKTFEMYRYWDERRQDWYRLSDMTVSVGYRDPRAGKGYYPIQDPETQIWYPCNPDAVWRYASKAVSGNNARIKTRFIEDWIGAEQVKFPENPQVVVWSTREELFQAIEEGNVPRSGRSPLLRKDLPDIDFWVGKKVGFGTPAFKRYKSDLRNATQPLSSWITPRSEARTKDEDEISLVSGTNDEGAKTIKDLFGEKAFNYAKPVSLIRELLRQSTSPDDLVLDFFAGSATTAQAVMELNAEDGGNRRFIVVSSTEKTADEPDKNLCRDVTAERIRRLNSSSDPKYAELAAGFAYLRTKDMLFEDLDYDLAPAEAWTGLEALHDLPLTRYNAELPYNVHEAEAVTLVLVDRFDAALIYWLKGRERHNLFIYAWAPGLIAQHLDSSAFDIRSVRETLVKGFQQ